VLDVILHQHEKEKTAMNTLSPMQRKPLVILMAAAFAASFLAAPFARAATIEESVSVQQSNPLTPKEGEAVSSAGAKLLQHVTEARARLAKKDTKGAAEALNQAEKLLEIIQASVPTTLVKDRIKVAKKGLVYEDSRTLQPDLIPLYSSLDEVADFMPLKTVKTEQGAQAKTRKPEDTSAKVEEPTDATMKYMEVDLPLHATRHLVDAARAYLASGRVDEADKSLKAVEQGVVHLSVAMAQPLFVARKLMENAVLDQDAGKQSLSRNELQSAIGQMELAEHSPDPYTREGAQLLLKEARVLQSDMSAGKDVSTRMRALWQHTQAYAERAEEYLRTSWTRMRNVSPFNDKLIEAKRFLSDAEIDLFIGREPAKTRQDLKKSLGYLDEAARHARIYYTDPIYKRQIAELQQSVRAIMGDPELAAPSQFEAAKKELGLMIRSL
jgi:hypothetical protein